MDGEELECSVNIAKDFEQSPRNSSNNDAVFHCDNDDELLEELTMELRSTEGNSQTSWISDKLCSEKDSSEVTISSQELSNGENKRNSHIRDLTVGNNASLSLERNCSDTNSATSKCIPSSRHVTLNCTLIEDSKPLEMPKADIQSIAESANFLKEDCNNGNKLSTELHDPLSHSSSCASSSEPSTKSMVQVQCLPNTPGSPEAKDSSDFIAASTEFSTSSNQSMLNSLLTKDSELLDKSAVNVQFPETFKKNCGNANNLSTELPDSSSNSSSCTSSPEPLTKSMVKVQCLPNTPGSPEAKDSSESIAAATEFSTSSNQSMLNSLLTKDSELLDKSAVNVQSSEMFKKNFGNANNLSTELPDSLSNSSSYPSLPEPLTKSMVKVQCLPNTPGSPEAKDSSKSIAASTEFSTSSNQSMLNSMLTKDSELLDKSAVNVQFPESFKKNCGNANNLSTELPDSLSNSSSYPSSPEPLTKSMVKVQCLPNTPGNPETKDSSKSIAASTEFSTSSNQSMLNSLLTKDSELLDKSAVNVQFPETFKKNCGNANNLSTELPDSLSNSSSCTSSPEPLTKSMVQVQSLPKAKDSSESFAAATEFSTSSNQSTLNSMLTKDSELLDKSAVNVQFPESFKKNCGNANNLSTELPNSLSNSSLCASSAEDTKCTEQVQSTSNISSSEDLKSRTTGTPTLEDDAKLVKISIPSKSINIMQSNAQFLNKGRNFLNFITEKSTNIMEKTLLPQNLAVTYNSLLKLKDITHANNKKSTEDSSNLSENSEISNSQFSSKVVSDAANYCEQNSATPNFHLDNLEESVNQELFPKCLSNKTHSSSNVQPQLDQSNCGNGPNNETHYILGTSSTVRTDNIAQEYLESYEKNIERERISKEITVPSDSCISEVTPQHVSVLQNGTNGSTDNKKTASTEEISLRNEKTSEQKPENAIRMLLNIDSGKGMDEIEAGGVEPAGLKISKNGSTGLPNHPKDKKTASTEEMSLRNEKSSEQKPENVIRMLLNIDSGKGTDKIEAGGVEPAGLKISKNGSTGLPDHPKDKKTASTEEISLRNEKSSEQKPENVIRMSLNIDSGKGMDQIEAEGVEPAGLKISKNGSTGLLEHPAYLALLRDYTGLKDRNQRLCDALERLEKENERLRAENSGEFYAVQLEALEKTIEQLKVDLRLSMADRELVSKECAAAMREKESMVMKYAVSERQLIDTQRAREYAERKFKEAFKEQELLQNKLKQVQGERTRICNILDSKCHELTDAQREVEKLKEESNMREVKLKWSQNKLKTEMEAQKELQQKLDKAMVRINEMKEECDQVRRESQETIRKFQQSEENKAVSLDQQLKEQRARLIMERHVTEDKEMSRQQLQKEVDLLKQRQQVLIEENNTLSLKVQGLEKERLSYESSLSSLKIKSDQRQEEIVDLTGKVSQLETLKLQLKHNEQCLASNEAEVARLRQSNEELQADMESCRQREAHMLDFTQKLTDKNVRLQSEFTSIEARSEQLELEQGPLRARINELTSRLKATEESLRAEQSKRSEECEILARHVAEQTQLARNLAQKLEDSQGENAVIRRKQQISQREMTRELQQCRKRLEAFEAAFPSNSLDTTSRTGSSTSLNTGDTLNGAVSDNSNSGDHTIQTGEPDRQTLIDRIVKLQRINVRRAEKLDFLEEHSRALLEELQKKTKIIQNYILHENFDAMGNNERDKNKAELARHGGIMASVYNQRVSDDNMTFELSLEINQKLQAVLEDTLLKNITLKDNIDTLGEEIARLTMQKNHGK